VIFIDEKSIAGNDYGALVKAILQAWERLKSTDFTDGVLFLYATPKQ
jgi:glutamate mutase epsilon subunit